MKRNTPNNPAARSKPRTTTTPTAAAALTTNESDFQHATGAKSTKRLQIYSRPTDETDLIADEQQVSLLDPREPRTQEAVKGSAKSTFTFAANMIGSNKNGNGDQSHQLQQQAKKAAGQKKNILAGAGDELSDDIESNSKARDRGKSCKWICYTIMALVLLVFLVVIALVSFTSLLSPEDGDLCLSQNQPFQQSGYRLFSTKTLYTTTLHYLSLVPLRAASITPIINLQLPASSTGSQSPPPSSSVTLAPTAGSLVPNSPVGHNNHMASTSQVFNYDRSSIYRPKFFSPNQTLESLHKKLTAPDFGCEARQFHLFGRHAARLPSEKQLIQLSQNFETIKKRIDLILSQSPQTGTEKRADLTAEPRSEIIDRSSAANNSGTVCSDPLTQFSAWNMFAVPKQGNLITEVGISETQQIASRFNGLYPHLFDHMRSNISIGVTKEIRTAQTAINFLRGVTNFNHEKLKICDLTKFPTGGISDQDLAAVIDDDECYKSLVAIHTKRDLSFHDRCASANEQTRVKIDESKFTDWISKSVSKKLRLSREEDQLNHQETKSLYDLCKYETAISGSNSIWCSLFTEEQLKLFEYLADIDDFFGAAYGNLAQAHSACVITSPLMKHYEQLLKGKIAKNEAHFYFTHSQVIQKLIAASINLSGDQAYSSANIMKYLNSGKAPKEREWQTSLLTPFSANLALTLYECPISARTKKDKSEDTTTSEPDYKITVNVGSSGRFKLVTSLNEQLIFLDGCDDYACDLDTLYIKSRVARDKECSVEEICGPEPGV